MPAKLPRYLKLGEHPEVRARAAGIWAEFQDLAALKTWRMLMAREAFEEHFAPHSRRSRALQAALAASPQVWLLAVTLGPALEERCQVYQDRHRPLEAYLLDRTGSFMAEQAMQALDREVEAISAQQGQRAGTRFSPGYQDLSLAAQPAFLALVDPSLGLYLSEDKLLKPEKSITAIKGAGPGPHVS
jgi:hypothetical protein